MGIGVRIPVGSPIKKSSVIITEMEKLEEHHKKVQNISVTLKRFYAEGKKVRIKHGGTNSTRARDLTNVELVDVSSLNKILEVNADEKYVIAEGNVRMGNLVEETLRHGFIPKVVPEFPRITVGGGVQGGAGESSSFKYGPLHSICKEYEVVLGNGKIVKTSKEKNADLFWGIPCSYGTLGILTSAKIELIPATKYIHLTYTTVHSAQEMNDLLVKKTQEKDCDFLDGILFSKERGVIISGIFTNKTPSRPVRFLRSFDEWFSIHVENVTKNKNTYEECVPIRDYLFRYDRGAFWTGTYAMKRYDLPFNRFVRFLLNPLLKTRRLYKLLHATGVSQQYVIQDITVPSENTTKLTSFIDETLHIYPLWFCPLFIGKNERLFINSENIKQYENSDIAMNIGVWGGKKLSYDTFLRRNRELEVLVKKLHGIKVLYAHTYYPEEEFWNIYDKEWYNTLRKKYDATQTFPTIYEKVFVSKKYTVEVKKGLLRCVLKLLKLRKKTVAAN